MIPNYKMCKMCGGHNELKNIGYDDMAICECDTICSNCKHKDYWFYGYYESDGEGYFKKATK